MGGDAEERAAFLAVARRKPARDRTLCETLHFTGCRPSELLEITPARVDLAGGTVAIRSFKKRKDASGASRIVYRSVPVPPDYLDTLNTGRRLLGCRCRRRRLAVPGIDAALVLAFQQRVRRDQRAVCQTALKRDLGSAPKRDPLGTSVAGRADRESLRAPGGWDRVRRGS